LPIDPLPRIDCRFTIADSSAAADRFTIAEPIHDRCLPFAVSRLPFHVADCRLPIHDCRFIRCRGSIADSRLPTFAKASVGEAFADLFVLRR
jgi:hypothetical protein